MKRQIEANHMIHSCEVCVHRSYCKQNKDVLLKEAPEHRIQSLRGFVFVPKNCPIINPSWRIA